jgi:3-dehydroquinate synthase
VSERVVAVRSSAGDYEVRISPGLLSQLGEWVRELAPRARVALITDANVRRAWGVAATSALEAAGVEAHVFEVAPGEGSKTITVADRLWGELIASGFSRADLVVALGGGVVGDLAGFVAATYHRGTRLVQVPTSLLAQVDSSVGGKVAVDHALGKNLVGAFHPARRVLVDTAVLQTLPERERWCGLAEMVKAALIADPELLSLLEANLEGLARGTAPVEVLTEAISASIQVKARIVSQDEHESGMRMWLNFGHTVAHGLETVSGYGPLTHGEAVVLGMRAAVRASERLGKLMAADVQRAQAILARFPRPPVMSLDASEVLSAMGKDKKAVAGKVRYVVLERIGQAGIEPELAPELLAEITEAAVAELAGSRA